MKNSLLKQNQANSFKLSLDVCNVVDLVSAGDRLANGYTESGMHEDAEEIKAMVAFKQEEHRCLSEEIGDNEQLLDAALAEQQNVFGEYSTFLN